MKASRSFQVQEQGSQSEAGQRLMLWMNFAASRSTGIKESPTMQGRKTVRNLVVVDGMMPVVIQRNSGSARILHCPAPTTECLVLPGLSSLRASQRL
jgi:hypothetical protein